MCEAYGAECVGTLLRENWLEMAHYWRELAGDETAQATTARLITEARRRV
jgi:hypothetical protein